MRIELSDERKQEVFEGHFFEIFNNLVGSENMATVAEDLFDEFTCFKQGVDPVTGDDIEPMYESEAFELAVTRMLAALGAHSRMQAQEI